MNGGLDDIMRGVNDNYPIPVKSRWVTGLTHLIGGDKLQTKTIEHQMMEFYVFIGSRQKTDPYWQYIRQRDRGEVCVI